MLDHSKEISNRAYTPTPQIGTFEKHPWLLTKLVHCSSWTYPQCLHVHFKLIPLSFEFTQFSAYIPNCPTSFFFSDIVQTQYKSLFNE